MNAPLAWSKREQAFLRKYNHLPRRVLFFAFQAKFNRCDLTLWNLKSQLRRMGLSHPSTATRRKLKWRPEEVAYIKEHHHQRRNIIQRGLIATFGHTELTTNDIKEFCRRRGWPSAYDGNNAPIGHEYLESGRVVIRVSKSDPAQPGRRNYAYKHRVLWEELNGPLPNGYMVLPINGDWFDFDPLNWLAVPSGVSIRLYRLGFFEAPPELKSTILATAKLKHAIAHRGKQRGPQSSG